MDEPDNRHFIDDYRLFSKSVVLSAAAGGSEQRWKNLERVWVLVGSETAFKDYLRDEIRGYLDGR